MDKYRRLSYIKTVFDAIQPSTGSLRCEVQNILGLFRWDLFSHYLAGRHFAYFEWNQGTTSDLARSINAR